MLAAAELVALHVLDFYRPTVCARRQASRSPRPGERDRRKRPQLALFAARIGAENSSILAHHRGRIAPTTDTAVRRLLVGEAVLRQLTRGGAARRIYEHHFPESQAQEKIT